MIDIAKAELRKIAKRKLVVVSPQTRGDVLHTSIIAVCKIFGLDYVLVPSKARTKPWICVTPEVETTLCAVAEAAHCMMLVIPEAARRLVDKRDLLIEFDVQRRLGADDFDLYDIFALAGVMGEQAQFEARCHQRNPNRSDLSIRRAWAKVWARQRRRARDHARNLKTKP